MADVVRVIAFDVNETLLDLSVLDQQFEQAFGSAAVRQQWFSLMLQVSFVGGLTDSYVDFTSAQRAALAMLARRDGVCLPDAVAKDIVESMSALPAHPEVRQGLEELADGEFDVVSVTNSTLAVSRAQLLNAGISQFFDAQVSADTVRQLKPGRAAYLAVASARSVPVSEVRLVASHHWDITGALTAGCRAAFVERPGAVLSPLGPQPDITGPDVLDVIRTILAVDAEPS